MKKKTILENYEIQIIDRWEDNIPVDKLRAQLDAFEEMLNKEPGKIKRFILETVTDSEWRDDYYVTYLRATKERNETAEEFMARMEKQKRAQATKARNKKRREAIKEAAERKQYEILKRKFENE